MYSAGMNRGGRRRNMLAILADPTCPISFYHFLPYLCALGPIAQPNTAFPMSMTVHGRKAVANPQAEFSVYQERLMRNIASCQQGSFVMGIIHGCKELRRV